MVSVSPRLCLFPALLLLLFIQLGLASPASPRAELPQAIVKRQASGTSTPSSTVPFPASNVTTSAGPTGTGTDPIPDTPLCSPAECPKACGNSTNSTVQALKRFLEPETLDKRFFEIPSDNPGGFTQELIRKRYTDNLSPDPTKFVWHAYEATKQYASAIVGLSGCTAVYVTSPKGMFSAHLWEEDRNTNIDLQRRNYEATLEKLKSAISAHKDDLAGGDAFVIIPTKPGRKGTRRYAAEIAAAIPAAVKDASGLDVTEQEYGPLNWKTTPNFGFTERGAAAGQYDPKYKDPSTGKTGPAVRLYSENRLMLEKSYAT